jgi:glucokinase
MTIGIDIGGTKCAVSRAGGDGRIEQVGVLATRGPDETLAELAALVAGAGTGPAPLVGICGGGLGANRGMISGAPNMPGWDDVPVVDFFHRRFGGPAYFMNDAKACALAEWRYGAGRGTRHMAFLTAGTGMGAGLILDGRLYMGCGNAGEVGHLRLAPDGPEGYGKRGSFEGFCSGGGIGRWAREILLERGLSAGFGCGRLEEVTAAAVAAAAGRGDPLARELLARVGARLGEALALLVDVLNLERIVLGSVYVRSRQWLEPALREALGREALPTSLAACGIVPAALGEQVGNYGAISAAEYNHDKERFVAAASAVDSR